MRQLPHKETLDVSTTQQAATIAGGLPVDKRRFMI